ncbi:MAG: putative toxin-antitoxin system toxin component, PIN family [Rhodospirillaceae bacterium]|nr:putative toxin-antitoxin system toxin component, PIN family [Rhodospirillaceae bacterium]
MTEQKKVVIDTNMLVSALLNSAGNAGQGFKQAVQKYQMVFTRETWNELSITLDKKKFYKIFTAEVKEKFKESLYGLSKFVEPKLFLDICRDQKDNKFISLAEQERAKYLVTGDEDLLAIDRKSIKTAIVTPRQFLEQERVIAQQPAIPVTMPKEIKRKSQ